MHCMVHSRGHAMLSTTATGSSSIPPDVNLSIAFSSTDGLRSANSGLIAVPHQTQFVRSAERLRRERMCAVRVLGEAVMLLADESDDSLVLDIWLFYGLTLRRSIVTL